MDARADRAETKCLSRVARWFSEHREHHIPVDIILAISDLTTTSFRAGELSAKQNGVRFRPEDEEITAVRTVAFVRG